MFIAFSALPLTAFTSILLKPGEWVPGVFGPKLSTEAPEWLH
jgi:hypothetical protein